MKRDTDPTRTTLLRNQFIKEIRRRYFRIITSIRDRLSLFWEEWQHSHSSIPDRMKQFGKWLDDEIESTLLNISNQRERWITYYVSQVYIRGAEKVYDLAGDIRSTSTHPISARISGSILYDTNIVRDPIHRLHAKSQFIRDLVKQPHPESLSSSLIQTNIQTQTYNATRFNPQVRDTIGRFIGQKALTLAMRLENELRGATRTMAQQVARELVKGFGPPSLTPETVSSNIAKAAKVSLQRATVIANTEMIRAHAEGELDAMESLGISKTKLRVEWQIVSDGKVCPQCNKLAGRIFSLKQARGMIPIHPSCRCSWTPVIRDTTRNEYIPILNCGGEGGKPGPCPTGRKEPPKKPRKKTFKYPESLKPTSSTKPPQILGKSKTKSAQESKQPTLPKPSVSISPVYVPSAIDPAANRPTKPEERVKDDKGQPIMPTAKPWKDPPPKKGVTGKGSNKDRATGAESQTYVGDFAELLSMKLGFRNILPTGQRSHKSGEVAEKGSTIDLEHDHSGRAYELKTCNTTSTEYRLKAKKSEKDAKEKFAQQNDLIPHVMVGVRDVDKNEIHYYAAREPGFTGSEVNAKAFDFVGSVSYTREEYAAFVAEQERKKLEKAKAATTKPKQ